MENYSRTAMFIPFSEYQKKVSEKQKSNKNLELDPDKFKGVKPGAIIGSMYPDLCSQAAYINKDIDDMKTKITESVDDLFGTMGEEAIIITIDSIHEHLDSFLELPNNRNSDEECEITTKGLFDLLDGVYLRKELAKTLLDLYLKRERMKELRDRQKMAQQNILL